MSIRFDRESSRSKQCFATFQDALSFVWNTKNQHAVLVGPGGAGKSTLLKWLFKELTNAASTSSPVPIYINLSAYEGSAYICRRILAKYCGSIAGQNDEVVHDTLWKLMSEEKREKPGFILFLDGINEVNDNDSMLQELMTISNEWTAVQIVISSRYMPESLEHLYTELSIEPLSDDTVNQYLSRHNKQGTGNSSGKLQELLKTPMYLTMYVGLLLDVYIKDSHRIFEVETAGELFDLHIDRLIAMTEQIAGVNNDKIDYTLSYLFPFIAWQLNTMSFSYKQIRVTISNPDARELGAPPAFVITDETRDQVAQSIISILVTRGLIVEQENYTYRFYHQNYLEFFCARYILNEIRHHDGIPSCMIYRLDEQLIPWLSDSFHEHRYSSPQYTSEIESWMHSRCAYTPKTLSTAVAVSNAIQILKYARSNRLSIDFSGLDLTQARFYCTDLRGSSFFDATVTELSFEPVLTGSQATTSANRRVVVSNLDGSLQILFADRYSPILFPEYNPSKIEIKANAEICTFESQGSVYALDLHRLSDGDTDNAIKTLYKSDPNNSSLSAYSLSDDGEYLVTAHGCNAHITQLSTSKIVAYQSDSNIERAHIIGTANKANIVLISETKKACCGTVDFSNSSIYNEKTFDLGHASDRYFTKSINRYSDFVLVECTRNPDTIAISTDYTSALILICLNQDLLYEITDDAIPGSVSFSNSEIRYRAQFDKNGEWIFDPHRWVKWRLSVEQMILVDNKWIRPYIRFVPFTSPEFSHVIATGKVFSHGKWSTTYNRTPRSLLNSIHADRVTNITGTSLSPSGKYAVCVLSISYLDVMVRVYDFQSMSTSVYIPPRIQHPVLNCYPVFLNDNTLCIKFDGVKGKESVFVIHPDSHDAEFITSDSNEPDSAKNHKISAASNKHTHIRDLIPHTPWEPPTPEFQEVYNYLSFLEILSLGKLARKNRDLWASDATARYLQNLPDKKHIPSSIVAISEDHSSCLFVYINMLMHFDADTRKFKIIEASDPYLWSGFKVLMSPDGEYAAIASNEDIRLVRLSDLQLVWQTTRTKTNSARTIPLGFSEDSLRFYIGSLTPDRTMIPQTVIYTENGFICTLGCSAASNELALTTVGSNSCNKSILFFNYFTGKNLYHWHNWFVNLDGCDFRGAVLQEDIANVIEDNGGIVK